MKFTITIECDNDAFQRRPLREVARILSEQLVAPMRSPDTQPMDFDGYRLHDINGNTVGAVVVTRD